MSKNNFLILSCAALFFLTACENNISEVRALSLKKPGIEEGFGIESYLSIGAQTKAKLTAPFMLRYQLDTPKVEFPKTLHAYFYDDTLGIESQLTAKYGMYLENSRKIYLKDSVRVFNRNADSLFCEDLIWDQNQEIFYTESPVMIRQIKPINQKIYGIGFIADQNFRKFTIKKILPNSFAILPDSTQ